MPDLSCARCCRAMSNSLRKPWPSLRRCRWRASPASTFLAFREALEAMREDGFVLEPGGASRLKRRIIERALTRCESEAPDEIEPLLTLLRRYAAEAAREEARLFCDELVAAGPIELDPAWDAVA